MYKVIIAGGRDFDKPVSEYKQQVLTLLPDGDIEIVSGTANGADKWGEKLARRCNYSVKKFPAKWNEHGKRAGPIRNREMAEYADHLIAFWDGVSKGTNNMIEEATRLGLKVDVINY